MRLIINEDEVEPFVALMRKRLKEGGDLTITLSVGRADAEQTVSKAEANRKLELVWTGIQIGTS